MPRDFSTKYLIVPEEIKLPNERWATPTEAGGVYLVSDHGRFFSTKSNRIIKTKIHKKYLEVRFDETREGVRVRKAMAAHRMVCKYFHPNPLNKPCVNHKDFNTQNNHFSNLEWVTPQENVEHSLLAGRYSTYKLSQKLIYNIRLMFYQGVAVVDISRGFNVNYGIVHSIVNGRARMKN